MAKSAGLEMFEEFYKFIKEAECIEDVMLEFGGIVIAVPAFVGEHRDKKIYEAFLELPDSTPASTRYMILSRRFNVGMRKVQSVIRERKGTVGLCSDEKTEQE